MARAPAREDLLLRLTRGPTTADDAPRITEDSARERERSGLTFLALATSAGLAVTALVALMPPLEFAYRNPSLHIVLETAEAMIALFVAYLMFGRFSQSEQRSDALLVFSLLVLGLTSLGLTSVSQNVIAGRDEDFFTWAPLLARTLGAATFAAGAWPVRGAVSGRPFRGGDFALGAIGVLIVISALVLGLNGVLPEGVQRTVHPATARPSLIGHPLLSLFQLIQLVLYGAAAVRLTTRARATGDQVLELFGAGAALAAIARVNFVIFPSLYSDYVYAGDFLRLGFYVLLLVGAGREIRDYWNSKAEAARLEERRRIARDLHDGAAHEILFLASLGRRVSRSRDPDEARALVAASDRALAEARRAVSALVDPVDARLDSTVAAIAEELTRRAGVKLDFEAPPLHATPETREQIVRIVREAITNAIQHGEAGVITVRLAPTDGKLRITVGDDGRGFDPDKATERHWSFGLISMRERAEALGGAFNVSSQPGQGAEVEVELPSPSP